MNLTNYVETLIVNDLLMILKKLVFNNKLEYIDINILFKMKRKNKKILMWLPFFIGMFFGNPFVRDTISFFGEETESTDSLDLFVCIMYHVMTLLLLSIGSIFII